VPMRLVFLSSASPATGAGHVMRSSAIAEEAVGQGIECAFIGSIEGIDWLEERVRTLGFSHFGTLSDYKPNPNSDVLILDSYDLDPSDFHIQQFLWKKIVVLADDLTPNYQCNLVVHPGLDDSWFCGDRKFLLGGPDYIPLRKSISRIDREINSRVKKIVVFGGGTDSFNLATVVGKALVGLEGFDSVVFFSSHNSEIEVLDSRFRICSLGASLDKELSDADLVLTTASTSSVEVVARGIPLGVALATDNQKIYFRALLELGLASEIGARSTTGLWDLDVYQIANLISDVRLRSKLVANSIGKIDFDGSKRIVEAIVSMAK
jgi:spore coat polysaccharide biosynthesis predicted glycosyltransferase SpsG